MTDQDNTQKGSEGDYDDFVLERREDHTSCTSDRVFKVRSVNGSNGGAHRPFWDVHTWSAHKG